MMVRVRVAPSDDVSTNWIASFEATDVSGGSVAYYAQAYSRDGGQQSYN